MTEPVEQEPRPSREEALAYKESLGIIRTREEAEAIVEQETKG